MLYTIAGILVLAWLLGMIGAFAIGTFLHVLLVLALVLVLASFIGGRRIA
jgi:hypothetical protein